MLADSGMLGKENIWELTEFFSTRAKKQEEEKIAAAYETNNVDVAQSSSILDYSFNLYKWRYRNARQIHSSKTNIFS